MKRRVLLALLPLLMGACKPMRYIFPSTVHFADSPVPPRPDYSRDSSWCALPWKKDMADATPGSLYPDQQANAPADVFFIHPTIFVGVPRNQYEWNADVLDNNMNAQVDKGTIQLQASVFNGAARIYAPRYRQAHITAFYTPNRQDGLAALDTAYSDVRAAFIYYLQHYNHGRPIIIAGHSQGGLHAQRLLKEFFDGTPLQPQLVAAYLVGWPVNPDSFLVIQPCRHPAQVDCYNTWNTFSYGFIPPYYKKGLDHAVCTNPLSWSTDSLEVPRYQNAGGVLRNLSHPYPGICDARVHRGLLWVHHPHFTGDALFHWEILHVLDYGLFYLNIRQNAIDRVAAYLKDRPDSLRTGKYANPATSPTRIFWNGLDTMIQVNGTVHGLQDARSFILFLPARRKLDLRVMPDTGSAAILRLTVREGQQVLLQEPAGRGVVASTPDDGDYQIEIAEGLANPDWVGSFRLLVRIHQAP